MPGPSHLICGAGSLLALSGPLILRCVLEQHRSGAHWGPVGPGPCETWASWETGHLPTSALSLPRCGEPPACTLFHHHPGAHSPALSDPLRHLSDRPRVPLL
ncbi:hypothetical protein [Streptomyces sp. NPDC001985]|uniref:hypothetical protein n=1 Tax=Streptomyces sp. NPDC001985 TaxID=3154406 RepID=UPI003317E4E0